MTGPNERIVIFVIVLMMLACVIGLLCWIYVLLVIFAITYSPSSVGEWLFLLLPLAYLSATIYCCFATFRRNELIISALLMNLPLANAPRNNSLNQTRN